VTKQSITLGLLATLSALMTAACGQLQSQGRAPAQITIAALEAGAGVSGIPSTFAGFLLSDVMNHTTNTVFDDVGRVTMSLHLKDPGAPGIANAPSALNDVTFTRYHVAYRRADGRNVPGVDVPYPFDSASTFTVGAAGGTGVFELVRHVAKVEAPLASLNSSVVVITTVADVTFYGKDQAGNDVAVTGSIQVSFGDFTDPS
jgi:hypothetical protein